MNSSTRIEWMDLAKGMSIFLVVLLHCELRLRSEELSSSFFVSVSDLFNPVRMPLFFAVSGFLAASSINKSWRDLLSRKVWRFVYIYALWSIIFIVAFLFIRPINGEITAWEQVSVWLESFFRPEFPIWFIWALAFYFPIAKLATLKPKIATAACIILGFVGASSYLKGELGFAYTQESLFLYLPFFVIPALYGQLAIHWVSENPIKLAIIAAIISLFVYLMPSIPSYSIDHGISYSLARIAGLCAGISISVFLCKTRFLSARFVYMGKNSLQIYLIHPLLIAIIVNSSDLEALPYFAHYGVALLAITVTIICLILGNSFRKVGANWLFEPTGVFGNLPKKRFA
ncbi:acyltransferase family protein [Cognatishimia activa]|uniref:Putative membrane protein n=1 Tax=Cognatishimia activa TaxID=1715691 RepID=A0A0P1IYD0_9RHOB|nr:acyltransferase [Cognatishimia activa]CUI80514.1 putative membrane protein [Cognatishimia activa]CUK26878.1 putative membrane protein [Cognatishimia activa]